MRDRRPCFDNQVAPGGYVWWYVDALSDDGEIGITVIAFIGSVFSPYYAFARRRDPAVDPQRFCALNVSLYGSRRRWAMTEHGRRGIVRGADELAIGRSLVRWEHDALVIDIDEFTAPLPRRLRGQVRVHPHALTGHSVGLDAAGLHRWRPIAPSARVEVKLDQPDLHWNGTGYLDSNDGDGPLEASFKRWDWARAPLRDATGIVYDVTDRDGVDRPVALHIDRHGSVVQRPSPALVALPRTGWRLPRFTRADPGHSATVVRTLQDSPFYTRSVVDTHLFGEATRAMHESLDLDRFSSTATQMMLPFRIPRALA